MKHRGQRTYLTYALNMDDELVHIDSVPNGNDCACFCPHCKSELCAKNGGEYKVHHFAHMHGADCAGALESALHLMAKEVLQEIKAVCLPAIQKVYDAKEQLFDKVKIEFYDKDTSLRPDCIGYYGDKTIWIEFKRTHAVDKKKKGKIISARIDCIEIDLNGCELEPNKMRDFLKSQSDKRIWIYNSEHQYSDSKKPTNFSTDINYYEDYHYDADWDDYHAHCVERTFAIDDNNRIVQSSRLEEIDMNTHSYFCLGCREEVCIDVDSNRNYTFTHIDDNVDCSDENYLVGAAKEILYDNFNSFEKFEIAINQMHICRNYAACKLYIDGECCTSKPQTFDLKSWGYDCCEKDVKLQDSNAGLHLYFSIQGNVKNAIGVVVKSEDDDTTLETSSLRLIEIMVNHESDLYYLRRNNLKEYHKYKAINFRSSLCFDADYSNVIRKIPTFILYQSGKSHVIDTVCRGKSKHHSSAVKELFLVGYDWDDMSYEDAKSLGLMYCHEREIKACKCNICFFFARTMDKAICKRYKTKGTPHYPLENAPINCAYFSLNRELVSYLKETYKHIKIIE